MAETSNAIAAPNAAGVQNVADVQMQIIDQRLVSAYKMQCTKYWNNCTSVAVNIICYIYKQYI